MNLVVILTRGALEGEDDRKKEGEREKGKKKKKKREKRKRERTKERRMVVGGLEADVARASGVLLELGCSTSAKDVARRIPASVLRDALGVCFLFTFKAGFVGSLSGGSGVVVCRGADGRWGPPSSLGVVGGGLGLQIGASASESVLVLNTESAVRGFSGTSQVRLGGDVTVAAGPLGRTAEGAVGVQRRTVSEASLGRGTTTTPTPQKKVVRAGAAIWSYSLASGAFAGVAMTGVYVRGRKDANAEFYGPAYRAWGATPADLVLVTPVAERLRDEAVQRSEALRTLYARLERAEEVSTHKHGAAHALAIAQGEHRKPGAVGGRVRPPCGDTQRPSRRQRGRRPRRPLPREGGGRLTRCRGGPERRRVGVARRPLHPYQGRSSRCRRLGRRGPRGEQQQQHQQPSSRHRHRLTTTTTTLTLTRVERLLLRK